MDLLNDLLNYEQEPFGSSVSEPDEALEQAKQAAIQEALDSTERKKRLKMLQDVIQTNPRQRQNDVYQEIIKSKYGFKPNSVGKKIGATVLETLMGGLSLGQSNSAKEAATLAEKDYANKVSGFNTLLSQENAAQKTANQSAQYIYSQMLKDKQAENKLALEGKKVDQTGQIKNRALTDTEERTKILKEAEKRKALETEAKNNLIKLQGEQISAKTEDILRRNQAIEEYNKSVGPSMQWDVVSGLKGKAYDNYMANVAKPEEVDNLARYTRLMTDAATRDKPPGVSPVTTTSTTSTLDPLTNHVNSQENKSVSFVQKPGQPRPELTPFTRSGQQGILNIPANAEETLKQKALTPATPLSTITEQPVSRVQTPQAKKIAESVTTPGGISEEPSDPVQAAKFNYQKSLQPYTAQVKGKSVAVQKQLIDDSKEIKQWEQTSRILRELSDTAANGLATGELDKFRGGFNQTKLVSTVRALTGRPTDEIKSSKDAIFALAEHLKTRFGSSSRPAVQLIKTIEDAINNWADTPEAYAKTQMAISLMSDVSYMTAKNPYFRKAMENLDKSFDGKPNTNWTGAVNQILEETVANARKGTYQRPSIDRVFNAVLQNIEKNKNSQKKKILMNDNDKVRKLLGLDSQD